MMARSVKSPIVFLANDGKLSVLNISIPLNLSILTVVVCEGSAFGVVLTSLENYAFVSNPLLKKIFVVCVTYPNLAQIVANLTGFIGTPTILLISDDDNTLFVACAGIGLSVVDISEKENPKFISQTKVGNVSSMVYYKKEGSEYLALTLFSEGSLLIFNVRNPTRTDPILLTTIYLGSMCSGISVLTSMNYLLVQTQKSLSSLDIGNGSNPVVVNEANISTNFVIKPTLRMAVSNYWVTFPTMETLLLYDEQVSIFGQLDVKILNGNKIYIISIIPVNPITLNQPSLNVSFLDFKLDVEWPYWISVDYKNNKLIITPPSQKSLEILRKIKVTYVTSISISELGVSSPKTSTDVFRELVMMQIISNKGMLLAGYNPTDILPLATGFNIPAIQAVLNKHYFTHSLTYTIEDFLNLDHPPAVAEANIQSQFDSKNVNPKINTKLDFQFNAEVAFADQDGDNLYFSAEDLPSWMTFDSGAKKLSGTPLKSDLGNYSIKIYASDGYKNISDSLKISVQNQSPTGTNPSNQNITLGDSLVFYLPQTTFSDPDSDFLTYSAYLIQNDSVYNIPSWLTFDDSRLLFYGKPELDDIEYDKVKKRYYEQFLINLTATDIADQSASVLFNVTVINWAPTLNQDLTLASQFNSYLISRHSQRIYVKMNELIDFQFSDKTFQDIDYDDLTYSIKGLPSFLIFTATRIYGSPGKNNVGSTYTLTVECSDSFSVVSDSFEISVINHVPILLKNISNVIYTLGQTFTFFIPDNIFFDSDSDILNYEVNQIFANGSMSILPEWLQFDSSRNMLTGNPTTKDITYNSSMNQYFQSFNICVKAIDIAEESVSTYFLMVIQNIAPINNPNKTLQMQIQNKNPSVDTLFEFTLYPYTFLDQNNGSLIYEARLAKSSSKSIPDKNSTKSLRMLSNQTDNNTNSSLKVQVVTNKEDSETSELPDWIKFDPQTRKFAILPGSEAINSEYSIVVTADNGLQKQSQIFSFVVQVTSTYILNYLLKMMGPILAVLGLIKYRILIYYLFFKRKYRYGFPDQVGIYENYEKRIYLISNDLEKANKIWKKITEKQKLGEQIIKDPGAINEILCKTLNEIESKKKKPNKNFNFNQNERLLTIIETFATYEVIQKLYPKTYGVFSEIRKKYEKLHLKNWYLNFIELPTGQNYDYLSHDFCSIGFKDELLEKEIQSCNLKFKKRKIQPLNSDAELFEKQLIKRLIKFDALGIPNTPLKWYHFFKYSKGESLLVDFNEIAFIQYYHTQPNTHVWNYQGCRYFSQLPPWLEMKIINNHLIFTGTPTKADEGNFIISLFDRYGMIYRQIRIEVIEKKQMDPSTYFMSFKTRPSSHESRTRFFDVKNKNPSFISEFIQTEELKELITHKSNREEYSPCNRIDELACVKNISQKPLITPHETSPRTFKNKTKEIKEEESMFFSLRKTEILSGSRSIQNPNEESLRDVSDQLYPLFKTSTVKRKTVQIFNNEIEALDHVETEGLNGELEKKFSINNQGKIEGSEAPEKGEH